MGDYINPVFVFTVAPLLWATYVVLVVRERRARP
jgi:hypothetical protein